MNYHADSFILKKCVFWALFVLLVLSCEDSSIPKKKIAAALQADNPDHISWDINVTFIDSSKIKATLKADRARIYYKRNETLLDGNLLVEFYSKKTGKKDSYLTADSARINDITNDMLASGNVVVVSDSTKTRLETSVLHWNNKRQKLFSTEYVEITSPQENIRGYGFESDPNLNNYTIRKVSGVRK